MAAFAAPLRLCEKPVRAWYNTNMPTFRVETPPVSYDVVVERGVVQHAALYVPAKAGKVFVVSTEDVWGHQCARLENALTAIPHEVLFLPGGEDQKRDAKFNREFYRHRGHLLQHRLSNPITCMRSRRSCTRRPRPLRRMHRIQHQAVLKFPTDKQKARHGLYGDRRNRQIP